MVGDYGFSVVDRPAPGKNQKEENSSTAKGKRTWDKGLKVNRLQGSYGSYDTKGL